MFKYEGAKCPICHAYLLEDDDIVVCPICGAPHHRDCWNINNKCGCSELHEKGELWIDQPENKKVVEENENPTTFENGDDVVICPNCGEKCSKNDTFCKKCAMPLNLNNNPNQNSPFTPPIMLKIDNMGGVDKNEDFDGVSAQKLSKVVGPNSAYYMSRFKVMKENPSRKVPNFLAFLITIPWLLYRRLIPQALIVIFVNIISYVPAVLSVLNENNSHSIFDTNTMTDQKYYYLSLFTTLLLFAVQFIFMFFGNKIYYNKCIKRAKKIDEMANTSEEFDSLAKKYAGVKPQYVYILFAGMMIFYLVQLFIL